jgi:hypothetical protein
MFAAIDGAPGDLCGAAGVLTVRRHPQMTAR